MTAITLSRQLGSLGDEVAQALAARLDYQVVCRDLINQAALRCGSPEMALYVIDDLDLLRVRPSEKSKKEFLIAIDHVLHEFAGAGNYVIVGRAGQVILRDSPGVLHVRVTAPVEVRIARIASTQNISREAAQARVMASDKARKNYLARNYHARWDDPALYDLVINTARIGPIEAACMVSQAITQCHPGET